MEKNRKNPYATNAAGEIPALFKEQKGVCATVIKGKGDLRAGKMMKTAQKKSK